MGIFEKEWTLNFTQCYPNGQLKYSELNNILQITASEHAENLGFGYKAMFDVRQSWVLSRMLIEIDSLPKYTQTVKIRTWIQDFTGSRSIRNFELWLGDQVLISASSLWMVFNIRTRRADTFALSTDHMEFFRDKIPTKNAVEKIDGNVDFQLLSDYRVKLSDLDIVNHANNVKYMEWCFDAMDPKSILKGSFTRLEMNFLKELNYGDGIEIKEFEDKIFSIQKDGRIHFLMRLTK
ncbi:MULTISPECIES: acyl-[acyl-carrier-protein] thioesterase [unclassified Sphingobacterium]|uniref:acyl-[acyl-carrier-protein] thioesterase n=1 Tax=unclassified Sphingobacterium TaxID=2609468 RepID=UPI0020C302DC|nr:MULTISPECIES: acyl-ACP thioesterase domain-containing protein [unclassified Sphingobacterium]